MSDLELDLADWGFTYGVAWAAARAQDPHESDDAVAERALAAAEQVFRLYCGDQRLGGPHPPQIRRRRARAT